MEPREIFSERFVNYEYCHASCSRKVVSFLPHCIFDFRLSTIITSAQ
jgi:hypothetical protein